MISKIEMAEGKPPRCGSQVGRRYMTANSYGQLLAAIFIGVKLGSIN